MRAIDCECGHTVQADDDESLVGAARQHIAEVHPEMSGMSDDDIRQLVAAQARDA